MLAFAIKFPLQLLHTRLLVATLCTVYIGSISASPTACPLHGYGCAGTQNDRLGEAVILSTVMSILA
jgi:hypothetical protein